MNSERMEEIANAVLYEGYMLYPYRPSSLKNRQRWNFGVVYPKPYSEMQSGADSWFMQTQCLAAGTECPELRIKVRFLQGVSRAAGELKTPLDEWPYNTENGPEPDVKIVESLRVDGKVIQTWQEASEREIVVPPFGLTADASVYRSMTIPFSGGTEFEPVRGADGHIGGVLVRTRESIEARVEVSAEAIDDGLWKITVRISNVSPFLNRAGASREQALMQSLLSAHTILGIADGEFVSLIDPPVAWKEIAARCENIGTWPVLAGNEGQRDGMLSSPIILYDYPRIAPESPGDLFDGTEIDEILALRILTLTDDEKNEMRNSDDRARRILERTQAMPAEHFMKLHGALRGMRPSEEEKR